MTKMLQFTRTNRATPEKRPADLRAEDFAEIYERFTTEQAELQASRCSQCGVPFCQSGCPLGNHIPDWLMLAAEGRMDEAYAVSSSTSALPEICGRICPQDRLCEGSCVIEQSGHGTVTIGAVEQYITEYAWDNGLVDPLAPRKERKESVGIIGSGPAALAAADRLRALGYQVAIYDRYDRAGGLLTYGIPGFKLEKDVVMRRVERLTEGGVVFHLNTEIGRHLSFQDLRSRHDGVLVATGVYKAKDLSLPGVTDGRVVTALDYLTHSNRQGFGDELGADAEKALSATGRRVVVIGGGDTAMDCVRTAIRQDAKSVTCLYRRDRENMPGSAREVANAEEEGVVFRWLSSPKAILVSGDDDLSVRVANVHLGPADASGRQTPQEIPGSREDLPADLVIKALGFDAEDLVTLFGEPALPVTSRGTVKVDPATFETPMAGVFAAGDIVRGASLVVWAVHDGQRAAQSIHERFSALARASDAGETPTRELAATS